MATRRSTPSGGWILESFNRLVRQRGYDGFSVTDVATVAGVGRSTFYEHFDGKGDVLRHAMRTMLETFASIVARPNDDGETRGVLEHIATHRPIAHRLLGAAYAQIARQLAGLIEARLPVGFALPRSMAARQIAAAQLGLLDAWLAPALEPCTTEALADSMHASTRALARAFASQTR